MITPRGCAFAQLDAAYVLGALGAAERAEYERHLPGCAECSRAVQELAGLPGLMGRVPAEVLEVPAEREPAPATLLPGVVAAARRSVRRRRTFAAAVLAAAVAVVAVALVGTIVRDDGGDGDHPAAAPSETLAAPEPMDSLGPGSVEGWVSLTEKAWGTRIDLTCTYGGHDYDVTSYVMQVRSVDGTVQQVGTWLARPGRETRVTMATEMSPADVERVVVRTAGGELVLRLVR